LVPTSVRQYVASQAKLEPWIEKRFAKKTNLVWQLLDVKEHFGLWLPARRSLIAGVVMMANKMAKYALPSQALEEISYPFLDQDLIEFVLAIPTTQLLRPGERRSLMRRSLAGIVPHEILSRRTKQFGARTPLRILQLHSRNLQEIFRTSLSSRFGFINGDRFCLALENVMRGKDVPMLRLLKIVSLEFWLRDLASRRLIETDLMPSQPVLREMAVQTNA